MKMQSILGRSNCYIQPEGILVGRGSVRAGDDASPRLGRSLALATGVLEY